MPAAVLMSARRASSAAGGGDPGGVDAVVGNGDDDLEVALELGLGAARADDRRGRRRRGGSAGPRSAAGRREPSGRSSTALDGEAAERAGGDVRSRSIAARDLRQVADPHRQLVGGVQAVLGRDVVEHVGQRAAARPCRSRPARRAGAARRRRPCPSRARGRRSSRAPPRSRTPAPATRPIHLKPVSVSAYGWPAAAAMLAEQRRGHDRARVGAAAGPRCSRCVGRAARRPRRRAASATRARRARPTAHRSASGSLATTRSAPRSAASGHRQVHRPRLLGVGEGDGREVGVGLAPARLTTAGASKPAGLEDLERRGRRRRRAAACRRAAGRAGRRRPAPATVSR